GKEELLPDGRREKGPDRIPHDPVTRQPCAKNSTTSSSGPVPEEGRSPATWRWHLRGCAWPCWSAAPTQPTLRRTRNTTLTPCQPSIPTPRRTRTLAGTSALDTTARSASPPNLTRCSTRAAAQWVARRRSML